MSEISEGAGAGGISEGQEEPPAKKRVRRGRVAAVTGSVLLAVAVVAGVGYTVVTVNGADRDAGAPVWEFPKDSAEKAKAAAPKGLAATLVPYGADGWSRGPDIGEYGSDAVLSGREATALRKEALSGLPRTQRKKLEQQIDKQRIQGIAMRSYVSTDETASVYTHQASTVSIELAQMDNKAAVRNISEFQNDFLDAMGVFREGPRIEGHKNARCFLPPADKDEKLDAMICSAYQGNVLVTLAADSAKPLQKTGIAMLLKEQLDRIAEPGESV
ncbi:hypothetical protein [Streptomyces sp. NPDC057257]|uniref:hypothetical protein n=1 Tax=Streptomyces sp. NPDC057257 TaxID=3346071 RepID=UPI00363C1508